MSLRRHVASGRGRPFAIPLVLGASLLAGIVTGSLEGAIDRWISLLLLFPALIGAAAGGLAGVMIHRHQLRAPALAMALGVAGGAAGYVAIHVVDYVRFRADIADAMHARNPGAPESGLSAAVDGALRAETGHDGFVGFLTFAARQGVTIKRVGVGDPGLTLPGAGAWAVWALELLFAAGAAGFLARARAREPFCERCEDWYGAPSPVASGGDASSAARKRFVTALGDGDLEAAATAFVGPRGRRANFALSSARCPRCDADLYCALRRVSARRAAHAPELEAWLMSNDELARLGAAITRRRAAT